MAIETEWNCVRSSEESPFLFVSGAKTRPPSQFMREMYDDCPVIYRWVPHVTSFGDMETYYIGQTSWLTQRIEDYRQTNGLPNNRLRKQFLGYARRGIKVGLEILAHCSGLPDGLVMEDVLVEDRRLIIESVLIDFYRDQGFTMLNCTY